MPNTYTQIYIQLIFAVKHRDSLIKASFKEDLHKYISGILKNQGQKLLAINSMSDHIHIFFGMTPEIKLADLLRDIKSDSSTFINDNKLSSRKFHWQEGYGAFSYSKSQAQNVVNYIINQPLHHKKETFREEYFKFLKSFEIEYDERYLFEFYE